MLPYLARWAAARRRSAWHGIDLGVAPPPALRPWSEFSAELLVEMARRELRWHEVLEIDPWPVRLRWLRGCYCTDGKHGR